MPMQITTPSVHKYKMFWIFQYVLHTDWNEWTNILKRVYIHPIHKKIGTSYICERREYKVYRVSRIYLCKYNQGD